MRFACFCKYQFSKLYPVLLSLATVGRWQKRNPGSVLQRCHPKLVIKSYHRYLENATLFTMLPMNEFERIASTGKSAETPRQKHPLLQREVGNRSSLLQIVISYLLNWRRMLGKISKVRNSPFFLTTRFSEKNATFLPLSCI